MKRLILIWLMFSGATSFAQRADQLIQQGNEYYKKQQFDKAEGEYSKAAIADPSNSNAIFNLGNALYKQNKKDEALKQFDEVAKTAGKANQRSGSYYNKGVVLTSQKKLEESIEAYKNALRQNPDDKEARENLQKALLELKKKNPPKPRQDDSQKKKQQKNQSAMSPKEAQQRLKLLEQKEKEVMQRMQNSKTGGSQAKDW